MKAITIWNPYPYLIGYGFKHYETRSCKTSYRGKIAIHSAKKNDYDIEMITRDLMFRLGNNKRIKEILTMQQEHGAVILIADLTDCIEITKTFCDSIPKDEITVGDFTIGRFAWKFENIELLDEPVKARGQQGLWNWDNEIE